MAIYSRDMGGSLVESFMEELVVGPEAIGNPKNSVGRIWGWIGESGEELHHQLMQAWADWIYTRVMDHLWFCLDAT